MTVPAASSPPTNAPRALRLRHVVPVRFETTSPRWLARMVGETHAFASPMPPEWQQIELPHRNGIGAARPIILIPYRLSGDRLYRRVPPGIHDTIGRIPPFHAALPYNLLRNAPGRAVEVERPVDMASAAVSEFVEGGGILYEGDALYLAVAPPMMHAREKRILIHPMDFDCDELHAPKFPASVIRYESYARWLLDVGRGDLANSVSGRAREYGPLYHPVGDRHEDIAFAVHSSTVELLSRAAHLRQQADNLNRIEAVERTNHLLAPWVCRASVGAIPRSDWSTVLGACIEVAGMMASLNLATSYKGWYRMLRSYLEEYALPHVPVAAIPDADTASLCLLA